MWCGRLPFVSCGQGAAARRGEASIVTDLGKVSREVLDRVRERAEEHIANAESGLQ